MLRRWALVYSGLIFGCVPPESQEQNATCRVERQEFSASVWSSGELFSYDSDVIRLDPIRWYRSFHVVQVVPQGSRVEKDSVILQVESSEVNKEIFELENQLKSLEVKLEEVKLDVKSRSQQAQVDVSQAKIDVEKAQLGVVKSDLIPANEQKKARLDVVAAEERLDSARARLRTTTNQGKTQIRSEELRIKSESEKLASMRAGKAALTITAQKSGVVIFRPVKTRDAMEKQVMGAGVKVEANQILGEVVDPTQLRLRSHIAEIDMDRLEKGQKVLTQFRIGTQSEGTLLSIGQVPSSRADKEGLQSFRPQDLLKTVAVEVEFAELPAHLVPGMSARVQVITDQEPQALVVGLDCIDIPEAGKATSGRLQDREGLWHDVKIKGLNLSHAWLDDGAKEGEYIRVL